MSEIRKTEKKIKGRSLPGLLPVQPSQLAGPASSRPSPSPSSVVFVPTEGGECGRRAHAPPRHATSLPACLPSSPRLDAHGRRHASPLLSLTPPRLFPPLPRSLTHGRTPPSPPFAIATVSGHPLLPRLAQKLRLDPLFLPTAPRASGSPASLPRRRSPLRAPTIIAVEFAVSSASPSPLRRPARQWQKSAVHRAGDRQLQ